MDYGPPGSSVHGILQAKSTGVGCHSLLQGIFFNLGTGPRSPALQENSLPSEPPVKPSLSPVPQLLCPRKLLFQYLC